VTGSRIGVLASARTGRTSARPRTRSSAPANADDSYPRRSSRVRGIGKTTPSSPDGSRLRHFRFRSLGPRSGSRLFGVERQLGGCAWVKAATRLPSVALARGTVFGRVAIARSSVGLAGSRRRRATTDAHLWRGGGLTARTGRVPRVL
jgi:hypothetical protein